MTRVRVEDLPLAVRRKIAEGSTAERTPAAPRRDAGGKPAPPSAYPPPRYRCGTCSAVLLGLAPAERHAHGHGAARLELLQGGAAAE